MMRKTILGAMSLLLVWVQITAHPTENEVRQQIDQTRQTVRNSQDAIRLAEQDLQKRSLKRNGSGKNGTASWMP
jgi:signal transduction histidine kinase